jgi:hypothetical protein
VRLLSDEGLPIISRVSNLYKSQVDSLTLARLRTLESKEDKESKVVTGFCGIADMVKEAEVIIRALTTNLVSQQTEVEEQTYGESSSNLP